MGTKLIQSFLARHREGNTSLLFWASNLTDYCRGRIVEFDEEYVLVRDFDEETEKPYELLLRLDNVVAIYPSMEQQEEDQKFKKIIDLYQKNQE